MKTRAVESTGRRVRKLQIALVCLWLSLGFTAAIGQTLPIDAALPDFIETGTPPFVVLGPEALGLSAAPVDLQQMPDGRILAFGRGEFALGDGVRWEVFHQAADDPRVSTTSVAIDESGRIYAGMAGGFGRISFDQNGRWRCLRAGELPSDLANQTDAITGVSMVGGNWYWSWGSGPIIAWKPGGVPRTAGELNALERIFTMGSGVFMSDQSNGTLFKMTEGRFHAIAGTSNRWNTNQVITCAVPLEKGITLVGAISLGLLRYDGTTFQPFVSQGPLAGSHRINDLCDVGYGMFAVAAENVGVVFIDRKGRIIQSLDRSVDNRLARVKRLLRTPGGVVWALLNEGIVRISFPSRFSSLEAMVTTGLAFSQPYRHDGRLWLLADGQAQRGVYDDEHRLNRFEVDTPGPFLVSLTDLDGDWVAATENGAFRHNPGGGWTKLQGGPHSAYLRPTPVRPDCWLFAAENETGWLRRTNGQFVFERFSQPDMGHVYGAVADAEGVYWAELGTAKVARIEGTLPRPKVDVLGALDGLDDAWVQLFIFEGEIRVNMRNQILRYERSLRRFTPDTELQRRIPTLVGALGRPSSDALGRLWITKPDKVVMVEPGSPQANELGAAIPEGLEPLYFTPQSDGVMWMNEPGRLARFDPALPAPEAQPLQAKITRVELPVSGRVLFPENGRIPDLPMTDSTLLFHYVAPNQSLGQSISFDVQLVGAEGGWVSTGNTGSITFNHIEPGAYHLRVRPRLGACTGEEAGLDFSVLTPWYRSRLSYLLFGIGVLAAINTVIWLSMYLARREQMRLERLVGIRTGELERQIQETTNKAAALLASEEHFRRLSDNAPDIIYRIRVVPDVGYDYVSPAVISITGYSPEEFLVDPAFSHRITQPTGVETIYDDALAQRIPDRVREIRWKTRDGRELALEERLSPVFDETGNLVAIEGIIRDFTQHKLLEEQLRQAQRMEAVGQLAGGVAHDYNNILTSTMMQLGLLMSDPNLPKDIAHSLAQLESDAERAAGLTRQLLMFSRRQVVQMKQIELNEVLSNLLKMLRRLLGETISLEFHSGNSALVIKGDPGMIEQVVTNLCVNARDAMAPAGGALTIDARLVELDAPAANENPEKRAGTFVCISVIDKGCGMDAATQKHIFEPFFTTKEVGKGTGLGLATVYGIVKQHGGWVDVASEVGVGTTFRVFFAALASAGASAPKRVMPETRKGTETILLVEDDHEVRDMVLRSLQKYGYRLLVASNGPEAMTIWNHHAAEIDLLFTDIRMPGGMSGLDLYERFRISKPALRVVFSSGYSDESAKLGTSTNPALVYLPKPYDMKTLTDTVRFCLDRV